MKKTLLGVAAAIGITGGANAAEPTRGTATVSCVGAHHEMTLKALEQIHPGAATALVDTTTEDLQNRIRTNTVPAHVRAVGLCEELVVDYPQVAKALERRGMLLIKGNARTGLPYNFWNNVGSFQSRVEETNSVMRDYVIGNDLLEMLGIDPSGNDMALIAERLDEIADAVKAMSVKDLEIFRQDFAAGILPLMAEQETVERNHVQGSKGLILLFAILVATGVIGGGPTFRRLDTALRAWRARRDAVLRGTSRS
ncbi:MAG TPA: hypothetical protein PK765_02430 [bacterium]|nr:hypothetical protein [bacterium]